MQKTDAKQLAALYFHFYPLFQQAYQNLGYPNGYFNDRLVATIDNLLAAPDVTGDIALVRPNVMYQFADPKLERLSAGQKPMLRMGPANAGIVKTKLRELRAQAAARAHRQHPPTRHQAAVQQIRRRILIGQHARTRVPVRQRGEASSNHCAEKPKPRMRR